MSDTTDLNSQEVKDAIAAAVAEAVDGLKTKNTELLGKLKKAQQGQQIDPADLAAVEQERDALKAQLAESTKAAKKLATEAEAAAKRADAAEGGMTKLLVENGLNEALAKAGVTNPVHQKAAKAMLATQVQIADDNGTKVPKVGEKALAEFITEWAGSDEGKHFVTAPDMSGGGAHNNGGAPVTGNKSSMSPQAKADFISKHGAEAYSNLSD
jgi:hypothetical protein